MKWPPGACSPASDGRVFVGVRVTGPVQGRYHYEYAVHNRDNRRGLRSLAELGCEAQYLGLDRFPIGRRR